MRSRSLFTLASLCASLAAWAQPALEFIENRGQWPKEVVFQASVPDATIWCERGSILIDRYDGNAISALHAPGNDHYDANASRIIRHHALRLRFIDATGPSATEGSGVRPGSYNYFIGNDRSKWASNAHAFSAVMQHDLYAGVDLRIRRGADVMKYDLIVAPNTDPAVIQFTYDGADKLSLKDGRVMVGTTLGDLVEAVPLAYQEKDGAQVKVDCHYMLKGRTLAFVVGTRDPSLPLVIDPVLDFSSYSGSTTDNFGYSATFDDEGFLYSGSSAFGQGYPHTTGAYQTTWAGGAGTQNQGTDIALSKFDTTGTHLIWSTFLGGNNDDLPHSLIVNEAHELVVLGTSGSSDFPMGTSPYDATFGGGTAFSPAGLGTSYPTGTDMIVAKLSADGSQLLGSTYLGGSANDGINSAINLKFNYADEIRGEVLLDAQGNIVVASCTQSADYPTTAGAYRTTFSGGTHDAVLTKLNPDLSAIMWSTFFGGTLADAAYAAEEDSVGNIFITGGTVSTDLPTTPSAVAPAYQGGPADGFVASFSPDGASLLACTYYGSTAYDQTYLIELDDHEDVYLLGQTKAPTGELVNNASYHIDDGGQLLVKLSHDLSSITWNSRFGATSGAGVGQPNISPTAFLVDYCDKIYVSGWGSPIFGTLTTTGLPFTPDAYQSTTDGQDFYLAVFEIDMSALSYATYFGGAQSEEHVDGGTSRFDRRGRVYQAVCAGCGGHSDFPTTTDALSHTNNSTSGGRCNLGVFKFDFEAPLVIAGLAASGPLCAGSSVQFTDLSHMAATYLWNFGDQQTSAAHAPQHTYASPGTYWASLTVTNNATCNTQDVDSIQIHVLGAAPLLEVMDDTLLCGPTASFTLIANSHGTAQNWIWSDSPSFTTMLNATSSDSIVVMTPPAAGTYYVRVNSPGTCSAAGSVNISTSLISASISATALLCADGSATVTLTGIDPGSTIIWTPADSVDTGLGTTQITATPSSSTEFHVDVTSPSGCMWNASSDVIVSDMTGSGVDATVDQSIVLSGTTVHLHATPASGVTYSWTPANGVSDPTIADPSAFVTQTTVFHVTVSDGVCTRMDSVTVTVHELLCEDPDIFVPDAFTPNGDGNNDILFVRGRNVRDLELKVFDRWGEVVFSTTDQSKGWDGSYKGKAVDPAVFVYWLTVHCMDGQEFFTKGNVTVIR